MGGPRARGPGWPSVFIIDLGLAVRLASRLCDEVRYNYGPKENQVVAACGRRSLESRSRELFSGQEVNFQMQSKRVLPILILGAFSLVIVSANVAAQAVDNTQADWDEARMEEFLRTAEVTDTQILSKGVTGAMRATLAKDDDSHDAQIQTVDIFKREMKIGGRTIRNFRDSYRYNIAAYEFDKLLGLDLVPVSVERPYKGKKAAFTWWVDPVLMTEATRLANNAIPPDAVSWNHQINRVRVFTQLIYDTDPNLGNLLITPEWRIWKVDLTRSFREFKQLPDESKLLSIDEEFYDALKALTLDSCKAALKDYLSGPEIKGLLARRDRILEYFDQAVTAKGREAVITPVPSD
jgi:hypothetical protein